MNKRYLTIGLVVLLGLLLAAPSWGQGGPRPERRTHYDLSTVETLTGTVSGVKNFTLKKRNPTLRVEMFLRTDQGSVVVHLGPADFVSQQGMQILVGDQVQVKGSRITQPRRTFIMAAEVRKGDQVMRLRDENGRPLWPVGRMRP